MKLEQEVEQACSTNPERAPLTCAWLDAEEARIYAADGFIMVRIPVSLEKGESSGPIPRKALKALSKHKTIKTLEVSEDSVQIQLQDELRRYPRPEGLEQPAFEKLLGPILEDRRKTPDIILNPELLLRLAKALCPPSPGYGIALFLGRTKKGKIDPFAPILVQPLGADLKPAEPDEDEPVGILMPMWSRRWTCGTLGKDNE